MDDNKAMERASERMSTDRLELYCRNLSKAKNDLTKYDRALLMDVSDRLCELQAALDQAEPANDPLTLEELRGMDGKPVWVERLDGDIPWGTYSIVWAATRLATNGYVRFHFEKYGETWLAYRRKPDGGGE